MRRGRWSRGPQAGGFRIRVQSAGFDLKEKAEQRRRRSAWRSEGVDGAAGSAEASTVQLAVGRRWWWHHAEVAWLPPSTT